MKCPCSLGSFTIFPSTGSALSLGIPSIISLLSLSDFVPTTTTPIQPMPIRKSELYSSLWQSCDELRGGMDASQYKDYVLMFLFVKYVSDKYAGEKYGAISVPEGASFRDMVELKGKPDVGDRINKEIVGPLARANGLVDVPDFNDATKLGSGKEMVDRLTNLIAIFESPALDFSRNRAGGDDILGDAYEYLMRHFARDSGKSKGQFYTPSEVSVVMAKLLGIADAETTPQTSVYDPTCGSGSLLLKVADEATTSVTLYGQEKDSATAGLAGMNMILHDNPGAAIRQGNTLSNPLFVAPDGRLDTFDYVVANPPFSDKRWSNGVDVENDPHGRFSTYGTPPAKQGDYAYLLHILRSMKSTGRGACILPHGVLFRGNAEGEIRRNLVRRGYIRGIIGLPANLFYGTGIPACIILLDKENAEGRKGIFMVDASNGFIKEGPKNRLRAQDIHRIVDVYRRLEEEPHFSRMVPLSEIEANDYNLNLPRYIERPSGEEVEDIGGHLNGGIPSAEVDALDRYWRACPTLRADLFTERRPGYLDLAVEKSEINDAILGHPEFVRFVAGMGIHFTEWRDARGPELKGLEVGCTPKAEIVTLAESLLDHYRAAPLLNPYDIYQHLMDYWEETMQDDIYRIAADGWSVEPERITEKDKKGKVKDKGWTSDLIPKPLVIDRFFSDEQEKIETLNAAIDQASAERTELEEEESGDEGIFADMEKVNKGNVTSRWKEIRDDEDSAEEATLLKKWLDLYNHESAAKKDLKAAEKALDEALYAHYPELTDPEIRSLVVDDKWMGHLERSIEAEVDRVARRLTGRIRDLAERYEKALPELDARVKELEEKVNGHLEKMGFSVDALEGEIV